MRGAIALFAVLGCASSEAGEAGQRYITIGSDAVETARAVAHPSLLEASGDVALLSVDATELDGLAEAMHERHHRCGGFMVHDSLAEARAALHEPADGGGPDYRLDRGPAVRAVLPALDQARI